MGLTPPQMEAMIAQAWEDFLAEFVGCLGEVPDAEAVDELRKVFDDNIKNGIENFGAIWDEPARSFALRYVCMTAKASKHCKDPLAECIPTLFEDSIKQARKVCDRVEKGGKKLSQPIGVLCPRK